VTVNRYINPETLADEFHRVRDDGRFAGFILYEAYRFLDYRLGGGCEISLPVIKVLTYPKTGRCSRANVHRAGRDRERSNGGWDGTLYR